jgi:hypothetical protein
MSTDIWDSLKRRFAYDDWAERSSLEESLLVWRFFISESMLTGWRISRSQQFAPGPVTRTEMIWKRASSDTDELLRLDIFECVSLAAAHEQLLQAVAEFQSGAITRMQSGIGDVAFGNGEFTQLFARANLVIMLRNAGRQLVSVTEATRLLDDELKSRPEAKPGLVAPSIATFQLREQEAKVGSRVQIRLEATDPLGRPVWFKLFASRGRLSLEDDRPTYQPDAAGSHQLTAFAVNENAGVATRSISLRVT